MQNELIDNIEKIHTTPLGIVRIQRNLNLSEDVVIWCKERILSKDAIIKRKGKNWYVTINEYILTINAHSYTIITAHKK